MEAHLSRILSGAPFITSRCLVSDGVRFWWMESLKGTQTEEVRNHRNQIHLQAFLLRCWYLIFVGGVERDLGDLCVLLSHPFHRPAAELDALQKSRFRRIASHVSLHTKQYDVRTRYHFRFWYNQEALDLLHAQ